MRPVVQGKPLKYKTDIFRRLKIHIHRWSKWSLPVTSESGNMYQFKRCDTCGVARYQKLKKIGVKAELIATALKAVSGEDNNEESKQSQPHYECNGK